MPGQSQNGLDISLFINNQYVTVRQIGKGGFGVVWQAYDFSLKSFVAVKELLPEFSDPKFVEMFYKEALIAKNIVQDNIVRVWHFWKGSNGSYYILMDFVNGTDLESIIKRSNEYQIKIPWEFSVLICMDVLKALDYANRIAKDPLTGNSYGIVYRDISPGNVLISYEGNVKLSDFGIAKTTDEINLGIKQKIVTGKFPYMSPEQVKGLPDIDHRSDIFSAGVVLYEMLTGKQLFSGSNDEIKSKILDKEFKPDLLNCLDIPFEIGEILIKSLQRDKATRYEHSIEMYRDLKKSLKGIENEEIILDFASFISKVMSTEYEQSINIAKLVKSLNIQQIIDNPSTVKIKTSDFIVGDVYTQSPDSKIVQPEHQKASNDVDQNIEEEQQQPQQIEAKGKTIFEEVGDWFLINFKNLKDKIVKTIVSLLLATLIFLVLDIFLHITPFGKAVYVRLNPPDVIITTVPSGASVTMKTKDGDIIVENANSSSPIALRKVLPQAYIVTAVKQGFNPVERIVRIEETTKENKNKQEKIEIIFDFDLNVNSVPSEADVLIDGNKYGVTPCKIQLAAGTHTIELLLAGFGKVGSEAKEFVEGQCNVDFSKTNPNEIFAEVDKNYWDTGLKKIDDKTIFFITGHLYKNFSFTSDPENMNVNIVGEEKPLGTTPLSIHLKAGSYKIRILDPNGTYAEATEDIVVSSDSVNLLDIRMKKNISFRLKAKDSSDFFNAELRIEGKEFNETKSISVGKPIIVPLPPGEYKFVFTADDFEPYVKNNVDITKINSVNAEMIYSKIPFSIVVVSLDANGKETPVSNAFIWINNKISGKVNSKGLWKTEVERNALIEGKIVAQKFIDQEFKLTAKPNKTNINKIILISEDATDITTVDVSELENADAFDNTQKVQPKNAHVKKDNKTSTKPNIKQQVEGKSSIKDTPLQQKYFSTVKKEENNNEEKTVVCPYCGYVNTIPAGRKLRFCVNCGKSLKY
ncbi:MAG: protein kinase [Endomicrobium sp.]|jgi:serine/threonine protein kinase|nr:protein kinase [Endomicrobium sp.]